ncbi:MAG: tyrosine-type recombinase/integrase [Terriglobia bacterium]
MGKNDDKITSVTPAGKSASSHVAQRIAELAAAMPELEDLSPEQVDTVMKAVVFGELAAEAKRRIVATRLDWKTESEAFVADKDSPHTRAAYARALGTFKEWLDRKSLNLTDLSPRLADDFIRDLRAARRGSGQAMDADSVRLVVAVCSAFYTFLEHRDDAIRNPFRGTRARPTSTWTVAEIPSEKEIALIAAAVDPITRAALAVVEETGLRIGGLPSLVISKDGTWWTLTKGKRFHGLEPLSAAPLAAIAAAGLHPRTPFEPGHFPIEESRRRSPGPATANQVIQRLKMRLARAEQALVASGEIAAVYSWQDFRHEYASRHVDRGISWLAAHLGHSSIAITERYLRNVLAVDTSTL